jgi:hypothetical protein
VAGCSVWAFGKCATYGGRLIHGGESIEVIIPRLRCEPKRVRRWQSLVIRVMVSHAQLTYY